MGASLCVEDVALTLVRGRHTVRVLRGISFQLEAGELLAVVAQRAQGKSTLLRVAAGIVRPDEGRVRHDGQDVWRLSDRQHSRLLAQDVCFLERGEPDLDLTVRELVALPLLREQGRRRALVNASTMLQRVGIADCASQRWASLAESERALLTLARAVARRPRLVLLDDLMVGLDIVAVDDVGRILRRLAQEEGFAVLLSVADTNPAAWCDRVGSLAAGKLVLAAEQRLRLGGDLISFPGDATRRALP
jgi:ABC-type cobalamin/Fe3+-siderophores transport system ATPase subunit